ncbi:MAG: hypothetical protein IKI19_06510, partial [Prevotella sp.]|nr:hypothetical protein [Prevotella sp.]MBR6998438.1 hypothetical protein [Prevotella sp.]
MQALIARARKKYHAELLANGVLTIDCVYHFALNELVESVNEVGAEDSIEMLKILITGKRLKDISDLPLD